MQQELLHIANGMTLQNVINRGMAFNRIQEIRKSRRLSQGKLAELSGFTQSQISQWETSERDISNAKLRLIAQALQCSVSELLEDNAPDAKTIPLVGYVGAGDAVECYDNDRDALDEVPCPPGINSETGKGYIVRGDSGEPYIYNGWCVFINRCFPGMVPEYVNELCIVKTSEGNGEYSGKVLLKVVRKGSKAGYYTLESLNPNSKPIQDVVIEESCVIDAMIPSRQFKRL